MKIITKQTALEKNLEFYFTGKPCKNGHISEQFTFRKRKCVECYRDYHERNKERLLENHRRSRKNNRKILSERSKKYRKNNLSKCSLKDKIRYESNKDQIKKIQKSYREQNPHIAKANGAKRRARQRNAVLKWSNLENIREFYKNCPEGYEVDHIIPLKHNLICGLHVENNLQYLTKEENAIKKNKFEIYYEKDGEKYYEKG